MRTAVSDVVKVPFKCDVDVSPCWYYNDFKASIKSEYDNLISKYDKEKALKKLYENHTECTEQQILEFIA
jgi:hypothetical protein